MELASCEYTVSQKSEGKWRLFRWLLVLSYIAFVGIYFVIIYTTKFFPLGALIPVFLWILIFFTWKYSKPDYKYVIGEAHVTFYRVIGKKAKEVVKIKISEAAYIGPLEDALMSIKDFLPKITRSFLPSAKCENNYIILYKNENTILPGIEKEFSEAVIFQITDEAARCLRFYNKATVMPSHKI
ncbi:MAG: hypothetical protein J6Q68_01490 [Clostridia bacterium]|nr:hypothetical protein [Clostridia bacterium]